MQKFNYQKSNKATGKIYIGLDHGYGNIKTAHRVFQTGIECYDEEPIVSTNYVKYRDKYYVIGESHLVYQGNKTESDDFYILTLAGLAEDGTMSILEIHDGRPMENSISTEVFGVHQCMEKIQKEVSKHSGVDVSEMLIEPLLRNGIGGRTDAVAMTTKRVAENYTVEIMKKLIAHGYREELVHLFIIGGGGCLLQNFSDLTAKPEVSVITDICANAKGYEALAIMKQRMRG